MKNNHLFFSDLHLYKVDLYHSSDHHIELKLLENENKHVLRKRDTQELKVTDVSLNVTTGPNGTVEETSISPPKKVSV